MTEELVKEIVIKEVKDRKVLNEGRNAGMGFAMLRKVSKDNYETVQPISPCKDYLNEVIFTEKNNIGTSGCGLVYPKKLDIFTDKEAYMVIVIQHAKEGEGDNKEKNYHSYSTFEEDFECLKNNYKNIQNFVNYFEDILQFNRKTEIKEASDNQYLVTLPIEWCQSTPAISLYSFLLRVSLTYTEGNPIEFIEKLSSENIDKYLSNSILPRIKKILENRDLLKQEPNSLEQAEKYKDKVLNTTRYSPHNMGVLSININ